MVVMAYHLLFWRNGQLPLGSSSFESMWWFGWVGVEIFFALSGYVIAFSAQKTNAGRFAVSRVVRLVPSIWICSTITLLATALMSGDLSSPMGKSFFDTLVMRPFGNYVDGVYWTLSVEIVFYIFVYLILTYRRFDDVVVLMSALGVLSAIFNILTLIVDFGIPIKSEVMKLISHFSVMQTSRLMLMRHGCFFAIGVLLRCMHTKTAPRAASVLFLILFIGCAAEIQASEYSHELQYIDALRAIGQIATLDESTKIYHNTVAILAWLLGFFAIFFANTERLRRRLDPHISPLRKLGLLTFPIYLLHNKVGIVIQWCLQAIDAPLVVHVLTFIAVLCLSWVVAFVIEPPFASALRRLFHGHFSDDQERVTKPKADAA